ncbi:thiamine-monophosphate kinase [Allopseudospirillum japonicum]|uniref:Thiamine-monophosphate kinase n=1 Tax=Allopseudospirillum japonicum TaxID=64971 RepID=A0A1H6UJ13_9GAMM|nr:thiamine-phosphate kinase [Allopseudospirillum japonicum]SEI88155.1 thiamine-monophosphate kinase [Allopseudospirillum japonicum]
MQEFDLIQHFFTRSTLAQARDDILLGIGDDCALLQVPAGQALAVSMDASLAGVHFMAEADPYAIGWRALAVNLSDLAAMSAEPAWFTLGLSLPHTDTPWLEAFCQGMADLASAQGISLVGGDTTRGPLSISIQVHGFVNPQTAWKRSKAQVGDLIYVTGPLGDAAGGLCLEMAQTTIEHAAQLGFEGQDALRRAYLLPYPHIEAARILRPYVHAAIDISDGFLADLGHLLTASGCGARIDLSSLPISSALQDLLGDEAALGAALAGGDDYQLCISLPRAQAQVACEACEAAGIPLLPIGEVIETLGIFDQYHQPLPTLGYNHFNAASIQQKRLAAAISRQRV